MREFTGCEHCKHSDKGGNEYPCKDCVHCITTVDHYTPKTNADRIRNMLDEELAVYTCEIQQLAIDRNKADRVEDAMQWLQSEVKEGAK